MHLTPDVSAMVSPNLLGAFNGPLFIGYALTAGGCIGIGIFVSYLIRWFSGQRAKGIVVDVQEHESKGALYDGTTIHFTATIEYTVDGQSYTLENESAAIPYHKGDQVKIRYSRATPSKGKVVHWKTLTSFGFVLVCATLALLVGVGILLVQYGFIEVQTPPKN